MATYAKILKDNSGNSILPYTRSKFVYMDDNSTIEDSIGQVLLMPFVKFKHPDLLI